MHRPSRALLLLALLPVGFPMVRLALLVAVADLIAPADTLDDKSRARHNIEKASARRAAQQHRPAQASDSTAEAPAPDTSDKPNKANDAANEKDTASSSSNDADQNASNGRGRGGKNKPRPAETAEQPSDESPGEDEASKADARQETAKPASAKKKPEPKDEPWSAVTASDNARRASNAAGASTVDKPAVAPAAEPATPACCQSSLNWRRCRASLRKRR